MNAYTALHLENVEIPANYMDMVKADMWENDEHPTFYLTIMETMNGICYECALLPFDDESADMQALNGKLEALDYEVNGYGWEEYLETFIEENLPSVFPKLGLDSEADTCGIYVMDSLDDYRELLAAVSRAIRELAE